MPTDTTTPPRRKWHLTRWLIVFIIATLGWSGWRAYAFRSALAEAQALGWKVQYTDPGEAIRKNWKAAFKKETWLNGVQHVFIPTGNALWLHRNVALRLRPKSLTVVDARTMHDVSDFKNLTSLQAVWLINCPSLTTLEGLENLPSLKEFRLHKFTGLTNIDAVMRVPSLTLVTLIDCTSLKNVDALKNLPALRLLQFDGCTGLANLDALKNLHALQGVYLNGCAGLTNVDALKNLSALQTVELEGCTGLTKENVAALKAALPNAKILSGYE